MGKKDKKKGKGAEKTVAKTERKLSAKHKKELALKGEEDIESLLTRFTEEDKKRTSVIEELAPPPSKRSSFTLTAHPDKDQLILYGGEYFNGNKTFMYNDLYFYNIRQDKWIKVISPGGPPPRSSHQAVALSQGGGQLWIFGGEFTSPTQSQFYHYKDLWVYHFNSKKWEKITSSGNGPSARSGHRMVAIKKLLVIFGGFHDNLRDYKYFNDVYIFSLENYSWKRIEVSGNGPCPRSGCQMLPTSDGKIVIYGGYSKERIKKDVDKGIIHSDMYILTPDKHDMDGLKWKWQMVKQSGIKPSPRCAFALTLCGSDKAIMFGGVYDTEDNEEELEGTFFNDLYMLELNKATWHDVRVTGKKEEQGDKRRRRKNKEGGEEEEEEDNEESANCDRSEDMKVGEQVISDDGVFTVTVGPSNQTRSGILQAALADSLQRSSSDLFVPPPRINAGLAVKKGILYLYGGLFEDGDKQLTLNDFYSLDLNKLEEWNTIVSLNAKDLEWFDSESDTDDDDDDEDEMSDDSRKDEQEEMEVG